MILLEFIHINIQKLHMEDQMTVTSQSKLIFVKHGTKWETSMFKELRKNLDDEAIMSWNNGEMNLVRNWGNFVILQHAPGLFSLLAHLSPRSIKVREGQQVAQGDSRAMWHLAKAGVEPGGELGLTRGGLDVQHALEHAQGVFFLVRGQQQTGGGVERGERVFDLAYAVQAFRQAQVR